MSIKRLASYLAGGTAAAAAVAMLTVAPANAEDNIYTGACGSKSTQQAFVGEAPTEQEAVNQARAAAASFGDECDWTFGTTKNECIAVAVNDGGVFTSAIRSTWTGAEDAAATQLLSKFPGQGARTAVAHCSGGGMNAHNPAAAAEPEPAPAPEPEPDRPCIPNPFNLNFPGAC